MNLRWKLRLAAIGAALACCGAARAQALQAPSRPAAPSAPGADDMAMPSDLGAPLATPKVTLPPAPQGPLSVDSPIDRIAASPQGRAALERELPGLCERPEYPMFKSMSLKRLAGMSSGRITGAELDAVQSELTRLGPVDAAAPPSHGAFYPFMHTASYSVRYGGREIKQISHSIYHRVVLVIASL